MRVVITGAGKGLALELLRLHSFNGDTVYALAHSMTDELKRLSEQNTDIHVYLMDIKDEKAIVNALSDISDASLDTVYNVAGIWCSDQSVGIQDTDMSKVRDMLSVNAIAPLCVMKHSKRLLKRGGIMLNVSSDFGSISEYERGDNYGYCMSKAALNMAGKIFMNETKDSDIRVYCYHPGWMRTQMGGEAAVKSSESISPKESASALFELLYKNNNNISGMFFDYLNKKREW